MYDNPQATRRRNRAFAVAAISVAAVLHMVACTEPSGDIQRPVSSSSGSDTLKERILVDEEFGGTALDDSVWNTCHWWDDNGCTIASNNELEWYIPGQASISDGALHLTAARRSVTGSDDKRYEFVSGMVTTGPPAHEKPSKLAFTYGKVEARIRIPQGKGLWPAVWLLPASQESRPEIDILEVLGNDAGTLRMHLHPRDRSKESLGKKVDFPPGQGFTDGWHTVALDWTPDRLAYFLDGQQVWEVHGEQVPDEPMYLVMNLAVGGDAAGPPNDSTVFPATFSIDYVRIRSRE